LIPAAQTVANMKTGDDGCLQYRRPSRTALSGQDWLHVSIDGGNVEKSPEEYFAMRADWVDKNPKATKALLKGIMEAQQWCDNFDNRKELAEIPARILLSRHPCRTIPGPKYDMGMVVLSTINRWQRITGRMKR